MWACLSYTDHGYAIAMYNKLYELVSYQTYMQPNEHKTCKRGDKIQYNWTHLWEKLFHFPKACIWKRVIALVRMLTHPKVYFLRDTSFVFLRLATWKHNQSTLTMANNTWPSQCRVFLKGLDPYNDRFVKIQCGESNWTWSWSKLQERPYRGGVGGQRGGQGKCSHKPW